MNQEAFEQARSVIQRDAQRLLEATETPDDVMRELGQARLQPTHEGPWTLRDRIIGKLTGKAPRRVYTARMLDITASDHHMRLLRLRIDQARRRQTT